MTLRMSTLLEMLSSFTYAGLSTVRLHGILEISLVCHGGLPSQFMVVTNKRMETRPQLLIGADQFEEVKSCKYVCSYIDTQLKCNVLNSIHKNIIKTFSQSFSSNSRCIIKQARVF